MRSYHDAVMIGSWCGVTWWSMATQDHHPSPYTSMDRLCGCQWCSPPPTYHTTRECCLQHIWCVHPPMGRHIGDRHHTNNNASWVTLKGSIGQSYHRNRFSTSGSAPNHTLLSFRSAHADLIWNEEIWCELYMAGQENHLISTIYYPCVQALVIL